eukprot:TRINITY_DN27119_c0_g1_i1.p4 TRINITY_DN27119_c0_g1~~TRINITY_DN27119_c0_g1_i1.p4  ORF type:complete len:162 (-),score=7.23 TRINITY_DN27119_c0_g1_i1:10-495(-)
MTDSRYSKLAGLLVNYSTSLQKEENVLIEVSDVPDEFTVELMRSVREAGAIPVVEVRHGRINREIQRGTNDSHSRLIQAIELSQMKRMQAYISIRGSSNANENSDIPPKCQSLYSVSYTHLRAHETRHDLVCRLLLEKKKLYQRYAVLLFAYDSPQTAIST